MVLQSNGYPRVCGVQFQRVFICAVFLWAPEHLCDHGLDLDELKTRDKQTNKNGRETVTRSFAAYCIYYIQYTIAKTYYTSYSAGKVPPHNCKYYR